MVYVLPGILASMSLANIDTKPQTDDLRESPAHLSSAWLYSTHLILLSLPDQDICKFMSSRSLPLVSRVIFFSDPRLVSGNFLL